MVLSLVEGERKERNDGIKTRQQRRVQSNSEQEKIEKAGYGSGGYYKAWIARDLRKLRRRQESRKAEVTSERSRVKGKVPSLSVTHALASLLVSIVIRQAANKDYS